MSTNNRTSIDKLLVHEGGAELFEHIAGLTKIAWDVIELRTEADEEIYLNYSEDMKSDTGACEAVREALGEFIANHLQQLEAHAQKG